MFGERRPEKKIFDEFEKIIEEMNETFKQIMHSTVNEPVVYGFNVHVGHDGVPRVKHFENAARPMETESVREPFTSSIIDEKNSVFKITAEMPGVEKNDIKVGATEGEVILKAENAGRKYHKSIKPPCSIDPDSAKAKYNNGVLEVTLKLIDHKSEEKEVPIE